MSKEFNNLSTSSLNIENFKRPTNISVVLAISASHKHTHIKNLLPYFTE